MDETAYPPATPIRDVSVSASPAQIQQQPADALTRLSGSTSVMGQLQELHDNAKLSKYRHFAAAERKLFYHSVCGWGVILIEIAIVIILLDILAAHPNLAWLKVMAIFGAAFATALSATQHYFDFHKVSSGHRNVANRYLEISKKCKRLIGQTADLGLTTNQLWDALKALDVDYDTLNRDAEAFPTAKSDYERALERLRNQNSP